MDELAKEFADLAAKYGPSVADAALGAARMEAYSTLVSGVIWIGVATAVALFGRHFLRKAKSMDDDFDAEFPYVVGYACLIVSALLCVPGVWAFVDPWTWTTISHPELWLAKQAFKL